jgi:putative endonuclease
MGNAPHITLGNRGEDIAAEHLLQKGYEILHRNWRYSRAEVDIIARIGNDWVFVEVKTRETDYFGYPEEAVTKAKQKQLQKAADAYLEANPIEGEIRFDIVAVILNDAKQEIHHIEDAFWPMDF